MRTAVFLLSLLVHHCAAFALSRLRTFTTPQHRVPLLVVASQSDMCCFDLDPTSQPAVLLGLDLAIPPRAAEKPSPITISPDSLVLIGFATAIAIVHPVPRKDLVFAVVYPTYLAVMNQWRFGGNAVGVDREFVPLLRQGGGPWFKRYVLSFALAGLLLPLPLVFGCFGLGVPTTISCAAAPHLLLTLVQCACEGLTRSPSVAALVRLLIPIGFNAYRMGILVQWSRCAAASAALGPTLSFGWPLVGLVLALANLLMWGYNLFIFLLWRTAPQYLDPIEFPTPPTSWRGALLPRVQNSGR